MNAVRVEADGAVVTIAIDRPDRMNALDEPARLELLEALTAAGAADDVLVVVLTGTGRAFCTGQDITRRDELDDAGATVRDTYNPLVTAIRGMPKPVVAAINGPAVGAGLGLALACDERVMAAGAYLSCAFSRVALVPDTGSTAALLRQVGHAVAFELARTGRRVDAEEALARGLVNEVAAGDELRARAAERAADIAAGPALALSLTKRLLVAAGQEDELAVLELEARFQGLAAGSSDHHDALTAFLTRGRAGGRDRGRV